MQTLRSLPLRARIERAIALAVMRIPTPLVKRLIRDKTHAIEGNVLDEQIQLALLLRVLLRKPDTHDMTPTVARRESERLMMVFAPPPREMARIDDMHVPAVHEGGRPIPIRVYVPKGAPRHAPMLVYYHGGGFVLGSLDSHDSPCRWLADEARCVVVSVDYRLAPEHKFPAAVDDSLAAFDWVAKNADRLSGDASRIAVGGDSAGGNLAAVVAMLARDRSSGPKPIFQLLIYPATDFRRGMPSHGLFRRGFMLDKETLDYFQGHYLRDDRDILDPRVSPLLASSHESLPPAFISTAGFDPLRDEGKAYADKLTAAGVKVTHRGYPSLFHGFFSTSGAIKAARPTLEHAAEALRDAWLRPGRTAEIAR